jgi:hypothetical protein
MIMSGKHRNETLADLLKEAADTFNVPLKLLNEILLEERIHLYLAQSSRQSVRKRLREIIQEEVMNATA